GLHESPGMLAPQSACEFQLFRGAAPRVPWRNGVEATPSPVPPVDQRLRLVVAGTSGIGEGGGCVAVHQDLAGNDPEVVPLRLRKKRVDRACMHRTKDECCRGPLPYQFIAEQTGGLSSDRRVSKGLLGDERVVVEPVQQPVALRADNSGLNIVNVRVDEAGRNQTARIVGNDSVGRQFGFQRTIRADRLDDAVATDHKAIGLMNECRLGISEKRIVAAKNQCPAYGTQGTFVGTRQHRSRYSNTSVAPMAVCGATMVESMRTEYAIPPPPSVARSALRSRT